MIENDDAEEKRWLRKAHKKLEKGELLEVAVVVGRRREGGGGREAGLYMRPSPGAPSLT